MTRTDTDPATAVYEWLARDTARVPAQVRLRLLTDALTGRRHLELVHDGPTLQVTYHVLAWPVSAAGAAAVPVLYFNVYRKTQPADVLDAVTDVDAVVDLLVPEVYRSQLRGALGGLSQGTHPVTGLPAFFLHPCQTERWMAEVADHNQSQNLYVLWFQTFGQVVGLPGIGTS